MEGGNALPTPTLPRLWRSIVWRPCSSPCSAPRWQEPDAGQTNCPTFGHHTRRST